MAKKQPQIKESCNEHDNRLMKLFFLLMKILFLFTKKKEKEKRKQISIALNLERLKI